MVKSFARFSAFQRGRIVGQAEAGASRKHIRKTCRKIDGRQAGMRAIDATVAHRGDPEYDGTNSSAGGRPRELTKQEQDKLKKLIVDEVGLARVTIQYCKKRLTFLRRLSKEGVRLALHRLGLAWRLRRSKSAIPKKHVPARIAYCKWVLKQLQTDLNRWAYIDGTSFYLARTADENEDKQRAALGKSCWRLSNGQDSLEDRNVGPSIYAKGQGQPIKIWGFLCDGRLHYYIVPKDFTDGGKEVSKHMNGARYNDMAKKHFAIWRKACIGKRRVFVAKDFEKFLRSDDNIAAELKAGCDQIDMYPKCSPDFNAIEGWWRRLKMLLEENMPPERESRDAFLRRLRRAVDHLNKKCRLDGRRLCRNQKIRARECLKLSGSRTKW